MKNDVSKKRKKTSKEKRVLVASLGIAAVVAAGSTFAWFTSQDEVTNRLSANAAYDVSVIETFTPPTNWIPGQKVNKDTSAVNTGNIPAFVKQKLSGRMQVTLEQAELEFKSDQIKTKDPETGKTREYIELTEDEVDVIEAGGFLAWASNGATQIGFEKGKELTDKTKQCYLGEVSAVHSGENIQEGDFGSDKQFAPPTTGDYIFRRVINVDNNPQSETYGTETYEYKGYHYEEKTGKYYQIKVINDLLPEEDGILAVAPKVYYGVEVNDIADLPLRFEAHDKRQYLLYTPVRSSGTLRKQYDVDKKTKITNDYGKFVKYMVDDGDGTLTTPFYLCIEKGSEGSAEIGTIYRSAEPAERPVGKVNVKPEEINDPEKIKEFDKEIETPDRLVATYAVGRSDDVFVQNPGNITDLSDNTAESYDSKLKTIAYSDYLKAEADYKTKKAQYELNKNAYEAGTALLNALAKNEKILAEKQAELTSEINVFNASPDATISALTFSGQAATTYTSKAATVNSAFGGISNSQLPKVNNFISKVGIYKNNPNDDNWKNVTDAYKEVTDFFTAGNNAITDLESIIVQAWNEAALNSGIDSVRTLSELNQYDDPANVSDGAKAAKAAASQLIEWEKKIFAYQKAVNTYFTSLSNVQSDAKYKLQDMRPLESAYEEAVKAHGNRVNSNETLEGLANGTTVINNDLEVEQDYKITIGGNALTKLNLNGAKPLPIKNSISDSGYAGTKIDDITGSEQFKIGDNAYNAQDDTNPPSDELVTVASNTLNTAKSEYEKYKTEHTNQEVNDDIVIYINLANIAELDDEGEIQNDKWKISPTIVPGAKEADFYYTSILGGGEVSSILVDSVELSGDTTNVAFKNFDFDLNVTVDSAQVVVSEDGRSYESTAVNANPQFIAKPAKAKYDKEQDKPVKKYTTVDWT